jgi:hypothetical protein
MLSSFIKNTTTLEALLTPLPSTAPGFPLSGTSSPLSPMWGGMRDIFTKDLYFRFIELIAQEPDLREKER